jgi:hypothetical protein
VHTHFKKISFSSSLELHVFILHPLVPVPFLPFPFSCFPFHPSYSLLYSYFILFLRCFSPFCVPSFPLNFFFVPHWPFLVPVLISLPYNQDFPPPPQPPYSSTQKMGQQVPRKCWQHILHPAVTQKQDEQQC